MMNSSVCLTHNDIHNTQSQVLNTDFNKFSQNSNWEFEIIFKFEFIRCRDPSFCLTLHADYNRIIAKLRCKLFDAAGCINFRFTAHCNHACGSLACACAERGRQWQAARPTAVATTQQERPGTIPLLISSFDLRPFPEPGFN